MGTVGIVGNSKVHVYGSFCVIIINIVHTQLNTNLIDSGARLNNY